MKSWEKEQRSITEELTAEGQAGTCGMEEDEARGFQAEGRQQQRQASELGTPRGWVALGFTTHHRSPLQASLSHQ